MSRQPAKRPELEIDIDEAAGNEITPVDTEMIKGSP